VLKLKFPRSHCASQGRRKKSSAIAVETDSKLRKFCSCGALCKSGQEGGQTINENIGASKGRTKEGGLKSRMGS